jgi:hypothetical protein
MMQDMSFTIMISWEYSFNTYLMQDIPATILEWNILKIVPAHCPVSCFLLCNVKENQSYDVKTLFIQNSLVE